MWLKGDCQHAALRIGWTLASISGNNLSMNIGKRLRELRKAKNLSQGDLERLAGFHRCYTSRVELGHTVPSLKTLERYAAALDVEMSQLFSGGGTGSPVPNLKGKVPDAREVKMLLPLFRRLSKRDLLLVLFVARDLVGRKAEHEKRKQESHGARRGISSRKLADTHGSSPGSGRSEHHLPQVWDNGACGGAPC